MNEPPPPTDASPLPTVDELRAAAGWQGHTSGRRWSLVDDAVRGVRGWSALDPAIEALARRLDPLAEGPAGHLLGGDWLGHAVHPLLTDIPIGCWTSASVLDAVGGRRSRPAAQLLMGLGVLGAVPTLASGWSEWARIASPELRRVGVVHAAGNSLATALYAGSWRARRRDRHGTGVVLGVAGMGVATGAGLLGGYLLSGRAVGTGTRGERRSARH